MNDHGFSNGYGDSNGGDGADSSFDFGCSFEHG